VKDNKAFTLIELLAIIVILGVITIVSVPSIATSNKKTKERDHEQFCQTIKNAAEVYIETHQDIEGIKKLKAGTINSYTITIDDLIATGFINSNLKDSNGASVGGSITASKSGSKIVYSYDSC